MKKKTEPIEASGRARPSRTDRRNVKLEAGKRRLAGWLQTQSEKLSVGMKKGLLFLGGLCFGGLMAAQIVGGLSGRPLPDGGTIRKPQTAVPVPGPRPDRAEADSSAHEGLSDDQNKKR